MPPISSCGNPSAREMKAAEEKIAQELAKELANLKLEKGTQTRLNTKTVTLLLKFSKELGKKHEPLLKNMCDRLDLKERTVFKPFVVPAANNSFLTKDDGIKMPPFSSCDNVGNPPARKMKTAEEKIAQELAKDFVNFKLGKGARLNTKTATLLRKLSNGMEKKHELLFRNICDRLDLNERNVYQTLFEVANEILNKDINWGRIVALYTFVGRVALYFQEHYDIDNGDEIANWLGNYLAGKSEWIRKAGGWETFYERFKDVQEENEKFWWNSLLCTTLSLGTLAAVLYVKS